VTLSSLITIDDLPREIHSHIFSFIGLNQYRWVAGVNRRFRTAYRKVFAQRYRTYCDASSLAPVQFCFHDIKRRCKEQRMLCAVAAHQGNLQVLQNCTFIANTYNGYTPKAARGPRDYRRALVRHRRGMIEVDIFNEDEDDESSDNDFMSGRMKTTLLVLRGTGTAQTLTSRMRPIVKTVLESQAFTKFLLLRSTRSSTSS
jgi:hypothetical protein